MSRIANTPKTHIETTWENHIELSQGMKEGQCSQKNRAIKDISTDDR